jgi:hypothetical protein
VTLFKESPHKNHRIGSLGLNLTCEGLLLGMWAEGHGDSKIEAHPQMKVLMNLHSEMEDHTHTHLRSLFPGPHPSPAMAKSKVICVSEVINPLEDSRSSHFWGTEIFVNLKGL